MLTSVILRSAVLLALLDPCLTVSGVSYRLQPHGSSPIMFGLTGKEDHRYRRVRRQAPAPTVNVTMTTPRPEQTTTSAAPVDTSHQYYTYQHWNETDDALPLYWHEAGMKQISQISDGFRTAWTLRLSFVFPFYGNPITNVTVASGGFIYMSPFLHQWLTATQYIAPLMAPWDASIGGNHSDISYNDTGSSLVVEWRNLRLHNQPEDSAACTFQAILHENGTIVFLYKGLSIAPGDIDTSDHPVKVGLSDAFYMDSVTADGNTRRTIHEYTRVAINFTSVVERGVIIIRPYPTCNLATNCTACIHQITNFSCGWCPATQKCSNGYDWSRQSWLANNCDATSVGLGMVCPAPTPTVKTTTVATANVTVPAYNTTTRPIHNTTTPAHNGTSAPNATLAPNVTTVTPPTTKAVCPVNCPPANCLYDSDFGVACSQCSEGYYGAFCYPCRPNCRQCEKYVTCLSCEPWFWSPDCSKLCSPGCLGTGECDMYTGECTHGCRPEFVGATCLERCNERCATCEGVATNCTECNTGYYGDQCAQICPSSCIDGMCHMSTGVCTLGCEIWSGSKRGCGCPPNCMSDVCDQNTLYCRGGCRDGYYGDRCASKCPARCQTCTSADERCRSCAPGTWGDDCQQSCASGCLHNNCNRYTGLCTDGCIAGLQYGSPSCPCPVFCKNEECDGDTGHCTEGCMDGYYGPICRDACYDKGCAQCPNGTRYCSECKTGLYGLLCQYHCPAGCLADTCNMETGMCKYGCKEGYDGTAGCACPPNCKNGACDRDSFYCTDGCVDGYYGQMCSETCMSGCLNCTLGAGNCDVCKPGWYGSFCQYSCPSKCLNNKCDQVTSACIDGCIDNVDDQRGCLCPPMCKNGACEQDSKTCSDGCEDGYYGERCSELCGWRCYKCTASPDDCTECMIGYYGKGCFQACPEGCSDGRCDKITGVCLNGCNPNTNDEKGCQCPPNCKDNACDKNTLHCEKGCDDGFYGDTCVGKCSPSCLKCSDDPLVCTTCSPGMYGPECQYACPAGCKQRMCNVTSGMCIYGCTDQYAGTSGCDCPPYCQNDACMPGTRHCTDGCPYGHYGDTCSGRCIHSRCSQCEDDGETCTGCYTGYTGPRCQYDCNPGCINDLCEQETGACSIGCETGAFGCVMAQGGEDPDKEFPTTLVVGVTLGAVALVLALTAIACFVISRRHSSQELPGSAVNTESARPPIYDKEGRHVDDVILGKADDKATEGLRVAQNPIYAIS